jgi:hypothetical protein
VNALIYGARTFGEAGIAVPANHSPLDERQLLRSPRLENDSSPQLSKQSYAPQHVNSESAAPIAQEDDSAGLLLSSNVAGPIGFKELGYDVSSPQCFEQLPHLHRLTGLFFCQDRMIDFTVEDFLCDCASMTSAMETELRRELELIAGKPETDLQRELDSIASLREQLM